MRRIKKKLADYDVGQFKSYPSHNPKSCRRPLFKEPCGCFGIDVVKPDNISQSLALEDLLSSEFSGFSSVMNWIKQKLIAYQFTTKLDSLLFHPGQLEVLKKAVNGKKLLIISDVHEVDILSLLLCLLKIDRLPSILSEEFASYLQQNLNWIFPEVETYSSDDIQEISVESGDCLILSLEDAMEMFQGLSDQEIKDLILVESSLSWIGDGRGRIDLSYPFDLEAFFRNNGESFEKLWFHLFHIRQYQVRPGVEDCIRFIEANPSLFKEDQAEAINQLRETIWQKGGDLGNTWNPDKPLENLDTCTDSKDARHTNNSQDLSIYFYLESLLSVVIISMLPAPLTMYSGGGKGCVLKRGDILDKAEKLAKLLGYQMKCVYPCECIGTALHSGLSSLQERDILKLVKQASSQDQGVRKAQNLARDLDSDDDFQEDIVEDKVMFDLNLTRKTIPTLQNLAKLLRKDIICVKLCLVNIPYMPIRTSDFIPLIQDASHDQIPDDIELNKKDVSNSIASLVVTGVLEQVYLRGETWIQAEDKYCSEDCVEELLKILDPFHVACEQAHSY